MGFGLGKIVSKTVGTLTGSGEASKEIAKGNSAAMAQLQPYTTFGKPSYDRIGALLGLGTPEQAYEATKGFDSYAQNLGYDQTFQNGIKALGANAAAAGGFLSGATQKRAGNYATGLRSRFMENYMRQLGGVTDTSRASAAGIGQLQSDNGLSKANAIQGGFDTLYSLVGGSMGGRRR